MGNRTILQNRALRADAAGELSRGTARLVALRAGEVWTAPAGGGDVLTARSGKLWITRTGDPRDYCLTPGDRLVCDGGRLVVQAMGNSEFAWEPKDVTRDPIRAIIIKMLPWF